MALRGISRFALLLLLGGCVYLPPITGTTTSHAITPDASTRLAQTLRLPGLDAEHPPRATLIEEPHQALITRLAMIDAAEQSLDLQYFIWQNDASGILMVRKILAAADRGVRVRALLDDIQMEGMETRLNALNDHPNIEIRIFNPFSVRWRYRLWLFRLTEFAIDGNRLNHRMHNKLLVADNAAALLGGRNIGDDYFGRSKQRNFIDLDVLVDGPAVGELSAGFDRYWNSRWAYPVNALLNLAVIPDDLQRLSRRIDQRLGASSDLRALSAPQDFQPIAAQHRRGAIIRRSEVLMDEPSVRWFDNPDEVAKRLLRIARGATEEVVVVTPYLIPTRRLFELSDQLLSRGVQIRALTNSLQTNDVVIAQAAYARFRQRLVTQGIELYEMRGDAALQTPGAARDLSLHQKYVLIDNRFVFIGSANLDPRSLNLNTELGLMLESPELAAALKASFENMIHPHNAWRIALDERGRATWRAADGVHRRTPAKSFWQRLRYGLFALLPLDTQL